MKQTTKDKINSIVESISAAQSIGDIKVFLSELLTLANEPSRDNVYKQYVALCNNYNTSGYKPNAILIASQSICATDFHECVGIFGVEKMFNDYLYKVYELLDKEYAGFNCGDGHWVDISYNPGNDLITTEFWLHTNK